MPNWEKAIRQRWPLVARFALSVDIYDIIFLGSDMVYSCHPSAGFPTAEFIRAADAIEAELAVMHPINRVALYSDPEIGRIIGNIKEKFPRIYAYHRITESIYCGLPTTMIVITNEIYMHICKVNNLEYLHEYETDLALFEIHQAKCVALRLLPLPIADTISMHLRPFD